MSAKPRTATSSHWLLLLCALAAMLAPARVGAAAPMVKPLPDLVGSVAGPDGAPVAGATVAIYTARPRVGTSPSCPSCYADCTKRRATDAAGDFRIPTLSRALIFRILVVRDGYAPTFLGGVDPLKGRVRVTLARAAPPDPARTVSGRVVGPDGQPVVGATVEPFGIKSPAHEMYGEIDGLDVLAVTNGRGDFQFRCPQTGGTICAKVGARGLANQIASTLAPGPTAFNRVTLSEGATVAGVVRDARGRGMPGLTVEVVPTDNNVQTFTGWQDIGTDEAGRFLVPNVPAGRQYAVCVLMDGLARASLGAPRRVVTVGGDGTTAGGIALTVRPAGSVTGRVTLSSGGRIPAGTRIMLARDKT